MALSLLDWAFVRVLELVQLFPKETSLAVEVVMLRHEVAVLRRQAHRPAIQPADREYRRQGQSFV
ncbi:MAG: hypothetical protein ACLQIB_21595 [Isosphaeraceae bacterium]